MDLSGEVGGTRMVITNAEQGHHLPFFHWITTVLLIVIFGEDGPQEVPLS